MVLKKTYYVGNNQVSASLRHCTCRLFAFCVLTKLEQIAIFDIRVEKMFTQSLQEIYEVIRQKYTAEMDSEMEVTYFF